MKRVKILLDDIDKHGEGCECGDCNSIGKSFGAGLYEIGHDEVIERVYAPSETSALTRAKETAASRGWLIVEEA